MGIRGWGEAILLVFQDVTIGLFPLSNSLLDDSCFYLRFRVHQYPVFMFMKIRRQYLYSQPSLLGQEEG